MSMMIHRNRVQARLNAKKATKVAPPVKPEPKPEKAEEPAPTKRVVRKPRTRRAVHKRK